MGSLIGVGLFCAMRQVVGLWLPGACTGHGVTALPCHPNSELGSSPVQIQEKQRACGVWSLNRALGFCWNGNFRRIIIKKQADKMVAFPPPHTLHAVAAYFHGNLVEFPDKSLPVGRGETLESPWFQN